MNITKKDTFHLFIDFKTVEVVYLLKSESTDCYLFEYLVLEVLLLP